MKRMSESRMKIHREEKCILCHSPNDDERHLGPKYRLDDTVVHYFCLLFACGLIERGRPEEGILGFKKNDILKEVKRAKLLKCVFCQKDGAASACCNHLCQNTFHFTCGLENDILFQFKSPQYNSFCSEHRSIQEFRLSDSDRHECFLCCKPLHPKEDPRGLTFIQAPCCHSLMHRECLQRQASTKTIDTFDCPACEDRQRKFLPEMQNFGIYIPEKVGVEKSQGVMMKPDECDLCRTTIHDELRLGPKLQLDSLNMHYFCYFFTYGLRWRGKRKPSFRVQDIVEAVEDAKEQECVFCKGFGATSNCCQSKCEVSYHYPCGLENGILSQFISRHCNIYCVTHRPRQVELENLPEDDIRCSICYRKSEADPFHVKFLRTPCCGLIFHRLCLQKRALNEDETTFRCPGCRKKRQFIPEMLKFGLFIPEAQALLEFEDESSNTSASSRGDTSQEQEDSSMDDLAGSSDELSRNVNQEPIIRRSNSQKSLSRTDYANHRSLNVADSSDSEVSNASVLVDLSSDEDDAFRKKRRQKSPLSSTRIERVIDSDHKRDTNIEIQSGSSNSAQVEEKNPAGSSRISNEKQSSVKMSDIIRPSRMGTNSQSGDVPVPPQPEEDEEIQFLRKIENSREGPYQTAIQRARKMLPNAFVQQNGRVHVKICKVCGYFTYAEGPSSYDHEVSQHRTLMKAGGNLFEEEELRENVAVLIMARQILGLN